MHFDNISSYDSKKSVLPFLFTVKIPPYNLAYSQSPILTDHQFFIFFTSTVLIAGDVDLSLDFFNRIYSLDLFSSHNVKTVER